MKYLPVVKLGSRICCMILFTPCKIRSGALVGGGGGCLCTPCDVNNIYGHWPISTGTRALKITSQGVCCNRLDPWGWSRPLKQLVTSCQVADKYLPQYFRRDDNDSKTPHSSVAGIISLLKRSSRNCKLITVWPWIAPLWCFVKTPYDSFIQPI